MTRLNDLIVNNEKWVAKKTEEQKDYFSRYANGQWPEFLWIGCADSRVVANDIIGMSPGDVFTHRNVGNIVCHSDMNCMSVLEYGIGSLKVKHVIVCGHYGCGAVKASLTLPAKTAGAVNGWIASIRDVRNKYASVLNKFPDDKRPDLLSELNALEQMIHVCTSPAVQAAWDSSQELYVHCVIYDPATGKLKILMPGVKSLDQMLELKSFQEGLVSSDGAKNTFDDSLRGLMSLESGTK